MARSGTVPTNSRRIESATFKPHGSGAARFVSPHNT
jgi:hypothetical protein